MKHCKVIAEHKSSFDDTLVARAGETVQIGKSDDEFPGWVWCTDSNGKSAWVPQNYLSINGDSGVFACDYDSLELDVKVGEKLEVIAEESAWLWCKKPDGLLGWVPKDKTNYHNE